MCDGLNRQINPHFVFTVSYGAIFKHFRFKLKQFALISLVWVAVSKQYERITKRVHTFISVVEAGMVIVVTLIENVERNEKKCNFFVTKLCFFFFFFFLQNLH